MKKQLTQINIIRRLLAAAAVACTLAIPAIAGGGIFEGKVSLDAATNCAGVSVQLINDDNGQICDTALTDASGAYSLTAPEKGNYHISFTNAAGYLSADSNSCNLGTDGVIVSVPDITLLSGDADKDGEITMSDRLYMYRGIASKGAYSTWLSSWFTNSLDLNRDGNIDETDLEILILNEGKTSSKFDIPTSSVQPIRRNNYASYNIMWENSYGTINTKDGDGMMQSGWTYDNRGSYPKELDKNPYPLSDISETEGVSYVRDLNKQTNGVITLKTSVTIGGKTGDGAGLMFFSENETPVYELYTKNGNICINQEGTLSPIGCATPLTNTFQIYAEIDLDKKVSRTYIDTKLYGEHKLASHEDIMGFKFFTGKEEKNVFISPGPIYANVNFGINETFDFVDESGTPIGWDTRKTSGANIRLNDDKELDMYVPSTASTVATPVYTYAENYFDRITGTLVFETLQYADVMADGLEIILKCGDKNVVNLYTQGKSFYANGVEVKKNCPNSFWNILRIEANTDTGKALIRINGQTRGEVSFLNNVPYIDGLQIRLTSKGTSITAKFDDLTVHQQKEVTDYVPTPVKPTDSNNYYVGLNMCNLWQNGEHWGWDNITPYDEAKTVLGYYDEDNIEMADWQIKFMVEHGIDYQAICWYGSTTNAPIKKTSLNGGLNKAYFNAKYSDMMDYCILWEASNGSRPIDLDAWKNYFVPYFIEYYLSDPRYARIDNKAVIGVFGADRLFRPEYNSFGSVEVNKQAYDYLEEECKKLGYDGCIFMACSTSATKSDQLKYASAGYDCIYAYNYGKDGYDPAYTQKVHGWEHDAGGIHVLPTVSVGFNRIGWGDNRTPMMTTAGMAEMLEWVKNTAWGTWYKNETENWKKKMMMVSTWNEYGEGTYIAPSGVNGFGYLDTIKAHMTDNNISCSDVVPTAEQVSRLGYLYPQYRQILRPGLNNVRKLPQTAGLVSKTISFYNTDKSFNSTDLSAGNITNINYSSTETAINATAATADPMFHINGSFDAKDVVGVAIRAKLPTGAKPDLFFKTPNVPNSNEAQKLSGEASNGGWKTYYFDLSSNKYYKGTITGLRFDPFSGNLGGFFVDKIEFYAPSGFKLFVDGNEYVMDKIQSVSDRQNGSTYSVPTYTEPYIDNGNTLIPYHPDMGIGYMLKLYHVWRRDAETLRLRGNGTDVTYTMGSSTAVVNGKSVELSCTPVEEDGIPMIPLEHLLSLFGDGFALNVTQNGGIKRYDITTPWSEFWSFTSHSDKYMWDFNHPGSFEGWNFGACSVMTTDNGTVTGTATYTGETIRPYDPLITLEDLEIDPDKYDKLAVRMKADIEKDNVLQFFYKSTQIETEFMHAEKRSVRLVVSAANNGEFVEYIIDLSNAKEGNINPHTNQLYDGPQYKDMDIITGFRIDPINCAGNFEIDYIRLYPSEDYLNCDTDAEFDALSYGNVENRTISNNTLSATSKYLTGSYHYDPQFYWNNMFIDASYYNTVEVTMTYNIEGSNNTVANLFFITSDMSGPDANHVSTVALTKADNGVKKKITFDLSSNAAWTETGYIRALRIDPLECGGSFTIESIKICHK